MAPLTEYPFPSQPFSVVGSERPPTPPKSQPSARTVYSPTTPGCDGAQGLVLNGVAYASLLGVSQQHNLHAYPQRQSLHFGSDTAPKAQLQLSERQRLAPEQPVSLAQQQSQGLDDALSRPDGILGPSVAYKLPGSGTPTPGDRRSYIFPSSQKSQSDTSSRASRVRLSTEESLAQQISAGGNGLPSQHFNAGGALDAQPPKLVTPGHQYYQAFSPYSGAPSVATRQPIAAEPVRRAMPGGFGSTTAVPTGHPSSPVPSARRAAPTRSRPVAAYQPIARLSHLQQQERTTYDQEFSPSSYSNSPGSTKPFYQPIPSSVPAAFPSQGRSSLLALHKEPQHHPAAPPPAVTTTAVPTPSSFHLHLPPTRRGRATHSHSHSHSPAAEDTTTEKPAQQQQPTSSSPPPAVWSVRELWIKQRASWSKETAEKMMSQSKTP